MYFRPPQFIRRMFPSLIWSMPETDSVYLTFDDGPTPGVTEFILDRLAEYDAKATFFCLGKNAEQHPHLFRMIVEGGHRIGNHTYSHQKGWYHIVMWDVLSRDYSQFVSPRSCLHNVTRHVRGGSIVAFHDSVKSFRNMRYALPRTLEYLREKGLKCAAIEL